MAIADAADLIRSGRCDVVYAGATQAMVTEAIEASYRNLRVLSPSGHTRPFDRRRDGFAFSEGAAVLVLEARDHALARGASIHAELAGSANTNDAHHMIAPSGVGAVACMTMAIADAGLEPTDIRHVNAHGTATGVNDVAEAEAIEQVLGACPPGPIDTASYSVTSIKGVTGHTAAASGAFEAIAVCLSFEHRALPPAGLRLEPDPAIGLPLVRELLPWSPGPTLSNSFGLGGHNCCLVLRPPT
jgi:3-oxoacyl-[acyl-carrier-protein] synthase II